VDGKRLFGAVSDKIQKRSIDQDRLGTDRGKVEAKGVFRRMQSGDVSLAGVHFEHLVNNTMLPFINPATQLGKKRDSSSPLLYRNEQFTKTGSGQT
jgi:hypothetical protein